MGQLPNSPENLSGTASAINESHQEDVAIAPVVEPAIQPDVPKAAESSSQALSIPSNILAK